MRVPSPLVVIFLLFSISTHAAIDAYPFPDEEMQQRYDKLIAELRCPQCLNTNLAGSDAMIAQDLRREVHRMLLEGHTDDEILDFMHERYGDFILYNPRIGLNTLMLWMGPVLFLLIAVIVMWQLQKRRKQSPELTDEDQARLDKLLADGSDKT